MGKARKIRRTLHKNYEKTSHISDLKFDFLKWLFSSILFFVGYYIIIRGMEKDLRKFLYIFGWNLIVDTLVEVLLRLTYMHGKDLFSNAQEYLQNLIESFLTSIVLFFGVVPYLQDRFGVSLTESVGMNVFITSAFWEMLMWILAIKLALVYFADALADGITFQSK